ncbi:n-alpha-acetyltransferase 20, NatB catalytic subunit-like protein [Mycena maculata]|uniref:N-alpha-acetyltransferase 20, NatB catalytic subunit-like protein n=1 Tax=Mycena maculata TaxID=230809 RepID=A0AAD7HE08_9AGAR|nr:n-alpha-acetyltransferase 20, NatB catalytic subunit-like protein [Mycena maculata]
MSVLPPFITSDMFTFSNVLMNMGNLLQYSPSYYLNYLARWPELCCATVAPNGHMIGYICGKAEGLFHSFHGHIIILTVFPPCSLLRLASTLITHLKAVSDEP